MNTLPGTIPGLLRRGSPVKWRGKNGLFEESDGTDALVHFVWGGCVPSKLSDISLDLSDPTGRVHAAWWCKMKGSNGSILGKAAFGDDMTPNQIGVLRSLVLRLAGVEG